MHKIKLLNQNEYDTYQVDFVLNLWVRLNPRKTPICFLKVQEMKE